MTKKRNENRFRRLKQILPYFLMSLVAILVVVLGTVDKKKAEINISLEALAANDYSVDQLSELYIVADLSSALRFASADGIASNYIIANTMREAGQTSSDRIEKPPITEINVRRGVNTYVVLEGENVDSIAAKFGLSSDQVRWSNGLKTVDVAAGTLLYLPSTPGIVYTVKPGETVGGIASKYGVSEADIVALNDLEVSGISEGMKIVLKNGSLPLHERPEYVAPVRYTYAYTYLGDTAGRQNITVLGYYYNLPSNGYALGQCTNWAWYKRQDLPRMLGNANSWAANAAAAGYLVDKNPAAGAIFQTSSGWFGHVGYVEAVNPDGSIVVSEMNYGVPYRVIQSTIPANMVGSFNYIH